MKLAITGLALALALGGCVSQAQLDHAVYLKAPYTYGDDGIPDIDRTWKSHDPGRHFNNPFRGRTWR